jgi:hypothetical protein
MVFRVRGLAALICAVVTLAGCGDGVRSAVPTAPTPTVVPRPQPAPPASPPSGGYPPITGSNRVFIYRDSPYPRVAAYTLTSRFVLYDDGRFALQYEYPIGEYRGTYTMTNGVIDFDFEGWSGERDAQGTLKDDMLSVHYSFIMQLTDFEDANYTRIP